MNGVFHAFFWQNTGKKAVAHQPDFSYSAHVWLNSCCGNELADTVKVQLNGAAASKLGE